MGAVSRITGAVTARDRGVARPEPRPAGPEGSPAHVAAAIAVGAVIALALVVGLFALVSTVAVHSERLETVWWIAAFGGVTPLALLGARRLLRAGPERRRLIAAGPCALLLLGASLAAAHALDGLGAVPLPWSLLLVPVVPLAGLPLLLRSRAFGRLAARADARRLAAAAVLGGGLLGLAAFFPTSTRDPIVLESTLVLVCPSALAGILLHAVPVGRRTSLALGILIPLAIALVTWDVAFASLPSHQDFYLGPANDIRHGRYMLVDDYSQYGVTVVYFLAAALVPVPFGYGGLVLVLGLCCSAMFTTIYAVLRIATRSTAFAVLGTLAAFTASVIATVGRTTQFPSTGFLRFGIPWLLVLALVVAYRRDRPGRCALPVAYALVALSFTWSFETAFYTAATFLVTVLAVALTGGDRASARRALGQIGWAAAASVLAVAALALITLAGRGEAPHAGGYIDFLRLYSVSGFGQLPIPDWSLGYLMGGLDAVSLAAAGVLACRARGSALGRPSAIVPLVAVTTFAAAALTYFLGRSHPNNLTHVAPPFVAMVALWAALAWRSFRRERHPVTGAALVLVALSGLFLAGEELPGILGKTPDSALAALASGVTGSQSLPQRIHVLTRNSVLDPKTRRLEALVRTSVPAGAPLLIAAEPDIATETLVRLDRSDLVPIGTPDQDGLSPARRDLLARAARAVPCGGYVVTQTARIDSEAGRLLFARLLPVLHAEHPFAPVAASGIYRVWRLGCGANAAAG